MRKLLHFFRSQIRYKIILPYLALTLLVMVGGAFVIGLFTLRNAQDRFDAQLWQVGASTSDGFYSYERGMLTFLRQVAFAPANPDSDIEAVSTALQDADTAALRAALQPYFNFGARSPDVLLDRMIVFDMSGMVLVDWEYDPGTGQEIQPIERLETNLSGVPAIGRILRGESDEQGDKFSGLIKFQISPEQPDLGEYYFYTVVPVTARSGDTRVQVGGILAAIRIERLINGLQQRSQALITTVYNFDGHSLASTVLPSDGLQQLNIPANSLQILASGQAPSSFSTVSVNQRDYQFVYGPLQIRNQQVGYFGVALLRDVVTNSVAINQWGIISIALALTVGIIAVGVWIARQITVPLGNLVTTAEAVREGDLERRSNIASQDELGTLADAFNQMTEHLLRLYSTSRDLSASIELERVLASVGAASRQLIPGTVAMALLRERDTWQVIGTSPGGDSSVMRLQEVVEDGLPTLRELARGQPLIFDGVQRNDRDLLPLTQAIGMQSLLLTPLMLQHELSGALLLAHRERGVFSGAAGQALRAVANMAISVLTNALLYRQVQEESSERQAILQSIADGVVVLDAGRNILLINRAAEQILNLNGWQDQRTNFDTLPLERVRERQEFLGSIDELEHYRLGEKTVRLSSAPVVTERGQVLGEVVVLHDISAEARVNQAKTEFIATISHELRTPLTVIQGYTDLLRRGYCGKLTPDQAELVDNVHLRAKDMTDLVNNVITIAAIESGSIHTELEPQDVLLAIEGVLGEMRSNFAGKGIELLIEAPENLSPVMADQQQLRMVLRQLTHNAYRYTERGRVTIRVQELDTALQIDVIDTGRGIPPEAFDRLFTRFHRVEGNNSAVRGSGLGLAITRQLVELQGGRIWASSEPGLGSQFSFSLPKANEQALAAG